jgi:dTDP-4-dehydrorhamnose 3,5-epimerase
MIFNRLPIEGAYIIDPDKFTDERGFFIRMFSKADFENEGLDGNVVQVNNSMSYGKGTLRGIHYQLTPHAETKIVRCIHGSIWDLVLDLRPDSPTFGKWHGEVLTADNRRNMYVPKGCGHAFLTLEDNAEVVYLVTEDYSPTHERIVRWDDPKFGIEWPIEPRIFSDKDAAAQDFDFGYHSGR